MAVGMVVVAYNQVAMIKNCRQAWSTAIEGAAEASEEEDSCCSWSKVGDRFIWCGGSSGGGGGLLVL